MVFDETGHLVKIEYLWIKELHLFKSIIHSINKYTDWLENLYNRTKTRLTKCLRPKKKIDPSHFHERVQHQTKEQRKLADKPKIFEEIKKENQGKSIPHSEVEKLIDIRFKAVLEQEAREDLNLLKGQEEIWFEFIDDFHRKVSFEEVV